MCLSPNLLVSVTVMSCPCLINKGLFCVLIVWKERKRHYLVSVRKCKKERREDRSVEREVRTNTTL